MVYCDFLSQQDNILTYAIGGLVDDITGKLIVDIDDFSFEVVEKPHNSMVFERHIRAMLYNAMTRLRNGEKIERLAYEI